MFAGRLASPRNETLTIGIDARCLTVDHIRGMGNYLCGMIGALAAEPTLRWQFFSDRPDRPFHNPLPAGQSAPLAARDCPGYRFRLWEQAVLPAQARWRGIDVLHCTQNSAPLWQPVPMVVTIHDTMIWDRDDDLPPGFYRDTILPRAFARAAALITISEQSKRDILRLWPALAPKLRVVPHGVERGFLDAQPAPLDEPLRAAGIREPYLLYCGGLLARKRLTWAVETFAALAEPALQLVVLGVPATSHAATRDAIAPELRARVCFAPFLAQATMPRLVQNAAAMLYPTLYEGFGFPALEAQAVGTPVLMSALGSLAELVGPGAVVLEPQDRDGWIAAAQAALAARRHGTQPNETARRWARQFSWEASAAAHHAIYRQAATAGKPPAEAAAR
ncbi:MAG TPA: glycosyltransferase family 1 protein [Stellaceae bacterium]|nr:glycosyltransferase family 1 protein [Stellaceae bacterium]